MVFTAKLYICKIDTRLTQKKVGTEYTIGMHQKTYECSKLYMYQRNIRLTAKVCLKLTVESC